MAYSHILAPPGLIVTLGDDLTRLAKGDPNVLDALAQAPRLDEWDIVRYSSYCLSGAVTGHPLLGDRPRIATSALYAINRDAGWARTLSRWYRLGRHAGERADG